MKFLITGDWHLTNKQPENRVDDYFATAMRKLEFIFDLAEEEKVGGILQPGDLTDCPSLSYEAIGRIMSSFTRHCNIPVFCCFGQHDLEYRRKQNTALFAMQSAGLLQIVDIPLLTNDKCSIYGVSFGEEIPVTVSSKEYNILLIHKMIIEDKLWEGQEDYISGKNLLRKYKDYNLIVSGDNHQTFMIQSNGRYLFNCGSLLRSSITQIKHKPYVAIFDTENPTHWQQIFIPIEPARQVFDLVKYKQEKEQKEELNTFVSGLSEQKEMSFNFTDNLLSYMQDNNIEVRIVELVKENIECRTS
jgi:DNA repair exonuclease SbcCD nuclease subunit